MNNAAPGWDGLSADSVKLVPDDISLPLTHILNLSFQQGVFPNELKTAKVSPLYKANDPMKFNNYRPISLLTIFSKIFEKLMYARLLDFLNKYHILYKYQFGFRKAHSTYMALILLLDNLNTALDKGEYAVGIFLDFQKAFDTVDHHILLKKLEHYGIRGVPLTWFTSYLSNREQYVMYDGALSSKKVISCGVPQGSILGPLLFLLYINDLAGVSKLFLTILFADDTNLFCTGKDIIKLMEDINLELSKIFSWLNANKLSLNIDKTNFMLFCRKNVSTVNIEIKINGICIKKVEHAKFLGVIIDHKLNWDHHIKYIKQKVAKGIGIIIKARKTFNKETLTTLYHTMILPYLSYCIHVWGTASHIRIHGLFILQKKIVRIICGVPPKTHSLPLFKEIGVLNIAQLYQYSIGLFMYKFSHMLIPPHLFDDMFIPVAEVHSYETRQAQGLYTPYCKTAQSQKSVRYLGSKLWNTLGQNVITQCAIGTFKKNLKIYVSDNFYM